MDAMTLQVDFWPELQRQMADLRTAAAAAGETAALYRNVECSLCQTPLCIAGVTSAGFASIEAYSSGARALPAHQAAAASGGAPLAVVQVCGHLYCGDCVGTWLHEAADQGADCVRCPACRQPWTFADCRHAISGIALPFLASECAACLVPPVLPVPDAERPRRCWGCGSGPRSSIARSLNRAAADIMRLRHQVAVLFEDEWTAAAAGGAASLRRELRELQMLVRSTEQLNQRAVFDSELQTAYPGDGLGIARPDWTHAFSALPLDRTLACVCGGHDAEAEAEAE